VTATLNNSIPADNLEIYPFEASEMSEPALIEAIRKVPVSPEDAVMFIYVGHGAYDATMGTYLTPSGSNSQALSATRILQEVQSLRPRLAVVMIDCCNRERAPKPSTFLAPGIGPPPKEIRPLVDGLFFQTSGSVLLVSSSPGEYALVRARRDYEPPNAEPPRGPLFMSAFGWALDRQMNTQLNWQQLTTVAQRQLNRYFAMMTGPTGLLTLDDGTTVSQSRQTIQLRLSP
jgi:hypothetical protein